MGWMANETGLEKTDANYVALTPLSHLRRASHVFADDLAVVYGAHRKTCAEYYDRCTRLASALAGMGVKPGDVVGYIFEAGEDIPDDVGGAPAAAAAEPAVEKAPEPVPVVESTPAALHHRRT